MKHNKILFQFLQWQETMSTNVHPIPVPNQFYILPIESKVHGGFVFLSLIFAVGALLGSLGIYGYENLTFKALMYVGLGLSLIIAAILLYRRDTHINRLINKTVIKIENEHPLTQDAERFRDFSYLFSLYIEQRTLNPEQSILLSFKTLTILTRLQENQANIATVRQGIINVERTHNDTLNFCIKWIDENRQILTMNISV